ncbi:MAG: 4-hydroxy-tetrahydrodipicolinate synthase [Candidatus Margulisbacteria bacterium]|nr:4-hydroxy-tetrahydrodipicolinate synthase [Candidatus Margulisiibacteriota bacterium]
MNTPFFGTLMTAMVTPFDSNGGIDLKQTKVLARKLVEDGSDAILVTGTTGESPTLSHEEDLLLYATVLDEVGHKAKVIAGTGSNSTETTIKYTKMAEKIGVHGAMIVVPYYNKPSQDGLFAHYSKIAENTELPLVIYNIPGRTGINMLPATAAKIVEANPKYIAIKEASGNIDQIEEVVQLIKQKDFAVYSGDDGLTLDVLKVGGKGVCSVASHLVGKDIKKMITAFNNNDLKTAEEINNKLKELFSVLFITSNPSPVKAALNLVGLDVGGTRLPLVPVNAEQEEKIKTVLNKLGLIK